VCVPEGGQWIWPKHVEDLTSSINLVVCLTTGPKPLPKRALHIMRSRASSFKWEYPLLFLRSSNSFVRLLPCLPVTSIPSCIFPSVTRCRRQFLRKMWPIQFAFRFCISCRIFLCSLTLSNTWRSDYKFKKRSIVQQFCSVVLCEYNIVARTMYNIVARTMYNII